ncbi:MAG TPA: dUTP diphosphatase [bacterium]|jgi:deoxyuridine 5'-triphosphate nucleotidohydrolase
MKTPPVTVQIQRLPHAPAQLPSYATAGAAGMDLRHAGEETTLEPGSRVLLPTGFCVAIPEGCEATVRLRSGFALQTGLLMLNAPGTIDSDYRGEIKLLLMNPGKDPVRIPKDERIAQLVIAPVIRCAWQEVERLAETDRSSGGFGSTGKS